MKQCIWCRKTEIEVPFIKEAHTIPQALGGKDVCVNVCDACNEYFGRHQEGDPSVEAIIKECFNISRARFLDSQGGIGKNKAMARFKSVYFNVDFKKHTVSMKPAYLLRYGFQERMGRQLRKGLYKMFLEEHERQKGDGLNERFDFIREFARYNLGDYPVFYFDRKAGIISMVESWAVTPKLFFDEEMQFKYLVREPSFFEFEFLGHVFGITTAKAWQISVDKYLTVSMRAKHELFRRYRLVEKFNDFDIGLSILDNHHRP
jgi:hypothetical protein